MAEILRRCDVTAFHYSVKSPKRKGRQIKMAKNREKDLLN